MLGVCLLMASLQAQRPYPGAERYGPPKPYHPANHYEVEESDKHDTDEYPCALVVPGLPGKSAAVDRYHYAKSVPSDLIS